MKRSPSWRTAMVIVFGVLGLAAAVSFAVRSWPLSLVQNPCLLTLELDSFMGAGQCGGPGGIGTHDSRIKSPGSFRRASNSTGSRGASGYAK
jgi:hypothetical protein